MTVPEHIVDIRDISHSFGGLRVLKNVTFSVRSKSRTGLIGPNGSGKTTLFNIVSGYLRPQSGQLTFRGRSLNRETVQERSRLGLVRTFQTPKVFEMMTVLENIMVGCCKLTQTAMIQDLFHTSVSRAQHRLITERAGAVCHRFDLWSLRDKLAGNLTAGQRRVLEIARAVVSEPAVLLLDEPSSGLNAKEIDQLRDWIVQINEAGTTIFLVSHDMGLMAVADTVHVLSFGDLIKTGTISEVQQDALVREIYLGV